MTLGQLLRFRPSLRFLLILATAVMALILLIALRDGERSLNEIYSPEEIAYFKEVALGNDEGTSSVFDYSVRGPEGVDEINNWSIDVRFFLAGNAGAADLAAAETIVRELDELIDPISISMVQEPQTGNLFVWLVPQDEFDRYLPMQDTSGVVGAGRLFGDNGEPGKAILLVASDQPDGACWEVLREEITQAFGLPHDSWRYPDSVFYQGKNEVPEFTEIDKAIIRLLYEPEIESRMTLEDLEKLGL